MSLHKYALIRYRVIDNLIKNKYHPYPSVEKLRSKCEESLFGSDYGDNISKSTIEKDLRAMREDMELGFEAPIKYSRAHKGYFYTDENYTIQNIPLNSDDVDAIKLAANTLFNFRESPLFSQFRFAIEKIFDRLNISEEVQDGRLDNFVQFDSYPEYPGNEHLAPIYESITDRKIIQISYQRFNSQEKSIRNFHPYLLKEFQYRWYVIGYSIDKGKIITYALDRIVNIESSDETFEIQSDFNADNFFKYSFGITESLENPSEIILKFDSNQKGYLETKPLHSSQVIVEKKNELTVTLTLVPSYELYEKILSYGDRVEVISPTSFRNEVVSKIKATLGKY